MSSMSVRVSALVCGVLATMTGGASLRADVIMSAQSVISAPAISGVGSWNAAINQSGLATPYTSGVTDFAAYIASNPLHTGNNASTAYTSSEPVFSVALDLGQPVYITQMAIWNCRFNASGWRDISIATSSDPAFATSTSVGSFTLTFVGSAGGDPVPAQVLDVQDSAARYVRITVQNRYSGGSGTEVSEIAFGGVIPAPGAAALLGMGGVMATRRRRAAQR